MENRRTMLTTGLHDPMAHDRWGGLTSKVYTLGQIRPFTQQLDVVFSVKEGLQSFLEQKRAAYCKRRWKMTEFIEFARPLVNDGIEIFAVGSAPETDDVWCLAAGVLTLSIGKETYEQFGKVSSGYLPWKPYKHVHVVQISLMTEEAAEHIAGSIEASMCGQYDAKAQAGFEKWDRKFGLWDTVISSSDVSQFSTRGGMDVREIIPQVRHATQMRMPRIPLPTLSPQQTAGVEDGIEEMAALFEWVGLACLGSPRLQVNDNPDPYLAVYDPPLDFTTEELVHIRWTGLLTPFLVQSVVDDASSARFVAITGQSVTNSPITHKAMFPRITPYPLRLPKKDGEDAWCVIITMPQDGGTGGTRQWMMTESIGPYDKRW